MKFYDRKSELNLLNTVSNQVSEAARMVVITGRRRIGKTLLSLEFVKDKPHLYLFVSKKSEPLLCREFVRQIRDKTSIPVIGEISEFKDIFHLLLEASITQPLTVVIDEFQEFLNINPSLFSELQNLWDQYRSKANLMVLFAGSVFSMMNKIFQDAKEPLFGRADRILHLNPFSIQTLHEILKDYHHDDLPTLFNYYALTGGLPKYIDILTTHSLFSFDEIINFVISESSPFLEEGKYLLIEEFGKEYTVYFSILELIASGKTGRSEIESILEHNVGGYLDRLENDYHIIKKIRPINAKPKTRQVKYQIRDLFLKFWFRFVYRHRTAVETGNFRYIQEAIHRNWANYSGWLLEEFFHNLFSASQKYNQIGRYWKRDNTHEIDLVAVNDSKKQLVVAEIKRNKEKISLPKLKVKAQPLIDEYPGYRVDYLALSLEDAAKMIRGSKSS